MTIKEPMPPKALQVLVIIGYEFNVPVDKLSEKTRQKNIVEARHIAMHILFNYIYNRRVALARIGGWLNRDHSAVIHGIGKVNDFLELEPEFKAKYDKIKKLTFNLAESTLSHLTLDERVMRLPDNDRAMIVNYIEKIEKNEILIENWVK